MFESSVALENNLAVSSIINGKHDQAMKLLISALAGLKAAPGATWLQKKRVETHPSVAQPQHHGLKQMGSECYAKWDGVFAFNSMLFLLPTELEYQRDNVGLLTMVLLYNLGSSRHMMGLLNGSSVELARAMKFYGFASEMMDNIPMSLSTERQSFIFRVKCCICTNMGHICEQMGDFNECRCCLEWLLDVMQMHENTANANMDCEDFDTYFAYYGIPEARWFNPAPAA
jgi:hypothetical protein